MRLDFRQSRIKDDLSIKFENSCDDSADSQIVRSARPRIKRFEYRGRFGQVNCRLDQAAVAHNKYAVLFSPFRATLSTTQDSW